MTLYNRYYFIVRQRKRGPKCFEQSVIKCILLNSPSIRVVPSKRERRRLSDNGLGKQYILLFNFIFSVNAKYFYDK